MRRVVGVVAAVVALAAPGLAEARARGPLARAVHIYVREASRDMGVERYRVDRCRRAPRRLRCRASWFDVVWSGGEPGTLSTGVWARRRGRRIVVCAGLFACR